MPLAVWMLMVLAAAMTATITSFREVDFSTAGMGFVMTLNPSALAGAPHTHIATVYAPPEALRQWERAAAVMAVMPPGPEVEGRSYDDVLSRVKETLGIKEPD